MSDQIRTGYIGVDLDCTLARYDGWRSDGSIGEPIPEMVNRVKKWLSLGIEVRIVTARACRPVQYDSPEFDMKQVNIIQLWCKEHIGVVLPVQYWKDYGMIELWDDRAIGVIPNTGRRTDGKIEI